jgi:transcription elongation factor GreA
MHRPGRVGLTVEFKVERMDKIPMTAEGYRALEDEVQHLKMVERPQVIKMIAEARAHGDLSENAEYHAAKDRQAFIEGRVMDLEDKLSRAEIIDVSKLSTKIPIPR